MHGLIGVQRRHSAHQVGSNTSRWGGRSHRWDAPCPVKKLMGFGQQRLTFEFQTVMVWSLFAASTRLMACRMTDQWNTPLYGTLLGIFK